MTQWEFYVTAKSTLETAGVGQSVGLATIACVGIRAGVAELRDVVVAAADGEQVSDRPWW